MQTTWNVYLIGQLVKNNRCFCAPANKTNHLYFIIALKFIKVTKGPLDSYILKHTSQLYLNKGLQYFKNSFSFLYVSENKKCLKMSYSALYLKNVDLIGALSENKQKNTNLEFIRIDLLCALFRYYTHSHNTSHCTKNNGLSTVNSIMRGY